VIKKKLLMKTR